MTTTPNRKNLTFRITYEKVYNIVFNGVTVVNTLIISITSSTAFIFASSALSKMTATILSSTPITFIARLLQYIPFSIPQNTALSFTISETGKITMSNLFSTSLSFLAKETKKFIWSLATSTSLSFSPLLVILNYLQDFDPDTLSTMDSQALQDLDYTLA